MSKYDKMVECNRKASIEKVELARKTILEMMDEAERITVPKLMSKTGLSRGFFYKNPVIRRLLDQALEQQAGIVDPRRGILDMAMYAEICALREQVQTLRHENDNLKSENQRLRKALDKKNMNLIRSL